MHLKQTVNNRSLLATGLPAERRSQYPELDIKIEYQGSGDACKAVALDHEIIPTIIKAVNNHDALITALKESVALLEDPNAEAHDADKVLAMLKATITTARGD